MTRLQNLQLPRADSDALRELHDHCQKHGRGLHDWRCETLNAYIYKLHEAGWTLQSIADPLGVTRERVRQRECDATQEAYDAIGDVTLPPRPKPQPRKPQRPKLRREFVEWLRQTQAVATQCRGWHGLDSPERQASEALWAAIDAAAEQGARFGRHRPRHGHAVLHADLRTKAARISDRRAIAEGLCANGVGAEEPRQDALRSRARVHAREHLHQQARVSGVQGMRRAPGQGVLRAQEGIAVGHHH